MRRTRVAWTTGRRAVLLTALAGTLGCGASSPPRAIASTQLLFADDLVAGPQPRTGTFPRSVAGFEFTAPLDRAAESCRAAGLEFAPLPGSDRRRCSGTPSEMPFEAGVTLTECAGASGPVVCGLMLTSYPATLADAVSEFRFVPEIAIVGAGEPHVGYSTPRSCADDPACRARAATCFDEASRGELACVARGDVEGLDYRWLLSGGRAVVLVHPEGRAPAGLMISMAFEDQTLEAQREAELRAEIEGVLSTCAASFPARDDSGAATRPASIAVERGGHACADECDAAVRADGRLETSIGAGEVTYRVVHYDDRTEPGAMYFALDVGTAREAECRCASESPASGRCDVVPATR